MPFLLWLVLGGLFGFGAVSAMRKPPDEQDGTCRSIPAVFMVLLCVVCVVVGLVQFADALQHIDT